MMSTLEHFLTEIGLPEAGRDCVLSPALPQERLQTLYSLLEQDEEACLQALKTETEPNGAALCLFSLYAFSQREAWLARGISEQIYLDTMRDLTLWYQACIQKTGRPGVMEWDWLLNSLKGRLVRLGRLQYEPGDLEEAIRTDEYSFPKGVRKLEIHIPADGKLEPEDIDEKVFDHYLDTHDIPDPDLLIRTSGEQRLSNYLLWQLAYTEFYFTDVLWPDFTKKELEKAIEQYNRRDRRYGGVKEA